MSWLRKGGHGKVGGRDHKESNKNMSVTWKSMTAAEKSYWQAEADKINEARQAVAATSLANREVEQESGLQASQIKRLNASRLQRTALDLADHPVWQKGLGIATHHAPLKPSLVVDLEGQQVEAETRRIFAYDPRIIKNPDKFPTFQRSCLWQHAGVCQLDPCFDAVRELVGQYDQTLQSKRLGNMLLLVQVRTGGVADGDSVWLLQGCVCRRPILRVMLRLWLREAGQVAPSVTNGAPKICTSQMLFLGLVRAHLSAHPEDVQLDHLRLQARVHRYMIQRWVILSVSSWAVRVTLHDAC